MNDKLLPTTFLRYRNDRDASIPNFIPLDEFIGWMTSEDIDIVCAAYQILMFPQWASKISPSISNDAAVKLISKYLRRCVIDDPNCEWAFSRYEAAWELYRLISSEFRGARIPQNANAYLDFLLDICSDENAEIREAIYLGVIEHILENPRTRKFLHSIPRYAPLLRYRGTKG